MSKHTPGPWWPNMNSVGGWEVRTRRDKDEGDPRANYGCDYGAGICGSIGDHTESRTSGNEEANAHLIAAAPDLLEALDIIVCNAVLQPDAAMSGATDCYAVPIDDIEAARAALAKARGVA